jgi:hypothetical protein
MEGSRNGQADSRPAGGRIDGQTDRQAGRRTTWRCHRSTTETIGYSVLFGVQIRMFGLYLAGGMKEGQTMLRCHQHQ